MQKNKKQGLWAIMSPVNLYIRSAITLAALSGITSIVGYVFLAYLIDAIQSDKMEFLGLHLSLKEGLFLLAGITIFSFIAKFYSFVISHLGAFKLEQILRTQLTTHMAQIPLGHIITLGTGTLKKVLLEDIKNLHAFVADTTPMIGKAYAAPIASLVALLLIDYRLAFVAIAILIVGAIIMFFVMKDSVSHRQNYEQSQSEINKAVIEFVQAMPVVRTFDDGTSSFKRYNEALNRYKKHLKAWMAATSTPARISMTILSPMPTLLAISTAGIVFLSQGSLEFSHFIAALLVSTGMADALMPLMWMSNFIKKSSAAAHRIQEIIEIPALDINESHASTTDTNIIFKDVFFRYELREEYALKEINFEVKANTVTALVGPSGAGKSTVAKLIPRFWDVSSGSIKIGNVDVKNFDTKTLMDTVSFVFQDTFLFNDTVAANIKMASPSASDEKMIEAAKAAQIHDFIISLPNGYETLAGERGASFSGGQKQRITIARAILRNTPIVVLDEATAFADPENEEQIIQAISNLTKDKTVIVIAHRLSTIKDVDQIIVFDKGKIAERGKHTELLQNKGVYAKLWANYEKAQHWDLHSHGGAQ